MRDLEQLGLFEGTRHMASISIGRPACRSCAMLWRWPDLAGLPSPRGGRAPDGAWAPGWGRYGLGRRRDGSDGLSSPFRGGGRPPPGRGRSTPPTRCAVARPTGGDRSPGRTRSLHWMPRRRTTGPSTPGSPAAVGRCRPIRRWPIGLDLGAHAQPRRRQCPSPQRSSHPANQGTGLPLSQPQARAAAGAVSRVGRRPAGGGRWPRTRGCAVVRGWGSRGRRSRRSGAGRGPCWR